MKFLILLLASLLALAAAEQPEADLSTNVKVLPDQSVAEWNRRTYYGHYYNPYGYYGHGYWRGRRSIDEKKTEGAAKIGDADQDVNEWHNRGYYGRYPRPSYYRHHYGHHRGRRDASQDQATQETYYPGWGSHRGNNYGGYPYRQHSYYHGHFSPSSYSYSYRH
ncbi:uncharacterized protein LOC124344395 [Daphnia pulicaria]|uniref:uncharacterized protein LOC124344395 n=1 Tax=Daphnia pulicaria TaxID=35523 RepID=UPI001EEBECE1|nr:uncharacterized protein LOC124344395 [Daphnia pulicaria]